MQPALDRDGVLICERVLSCGLVEKLRSNFNVIEGGRAGCRRFDLLQDIVDLTGPDGRLAALASRVAGRDARPVRVLFFDKTATSNWAVPWHQDRTIAVKRRTDVEGYGPWSIKDGVAHVEPPVALLEAMLTLRVFVDDCGADDGPLEVIAGSHRHGRLSGDSMSDAIRRGTVFVGLGRTGDVLVMKTLAVHRSKRAVSAAHRRVLHVDYATTGLPPPLEWMMN